MGCGGGQVVSMRAIYCNNPRLNTTEAYSFTIKFAFEKIENKQRRGGDWPSLKNYSTLKNAF